MITALIVRPSITLYGLFHGILLHWKLLQIEQKVQSNKIIAFMFSQPTVGLVWPSSMALSELLWSCMAFYGLVWPLFLFLYKLKKYFPVSICHNKNFLPLYIAIIKSIIIVWISLLNLQCTPVSLSFKPFI